MNSAEHDMLSDVTEVSASTVCAVKPKWPHPVSFFAVPVVIFSASRMIQFVLISWMIPDNSTSSLRDRLLSWDAGWFIRVAKDGYPAGYTYDESGHLSANGLAFFPVFPTFIKIIHIISGISYEASALASGVIAGCVATVAVYELGFHLYGHRVGAIFATLFCTQPMSVVLCMGYSEGIFVVFTAGAFVAVRRNAWLVAGFLGLGASLSRPTGAAVALAIALSAFIHLRSEGCETPRSSPIIGSLIALIGVPGFLLWVGIRAGSMGAWFDIQTAGWGTTFDWGSSACRFIADTLRGSDSWVAVSVAWILCVAVLLALYAIMMRTWPPLLLYGLISLTLVIGQAGFFHSKPRLMVPVLVILVPLAVVLGKARLSTVFLALTAYSAFGLWYGSYLITVWRFAI